MRVVSGDEGTWLRERLTSWATITGVVPTGYERYVRVLHPVEVDGDTAVRWRDVAAVTGRRVHPLVQWWRLIDSSDSINPSSELWEGEQPEVGRLVEPDLGTLFDVLALYTDAPNDVLFAIWLGFAEFNYGASILFGPDSDGNVGSEPADRTSLAVEVTEARALVLPGREYGVVRGACDDAVRIPQLLGQSSFTGPSPNIVWPRDRAWCVATEVDFDSTVVGCSARTAAALLDSPHLETFSIDSGDSLAYDADLVN